MTSSSYCELSLRQDAVEILHLTVQSWEIPEDASRRASVDAHRSLELTLRRERATSWLRLRLEGDELMRLSPERKMWTLQLGESLRDLYGFADLLLEEASDKELTEWSPLAAVNLAVDVDPDFRLMHQAIVAELEEVHLALARDVVSRIRPRAGGSSEVQALSAEDDVQKLREIDARLERALDRIGEQPSHGLLRERRLTRWKAGAPLSTSTLQRLARNGEVRGRGRGRATLPTKILVEQPHLTTDIEEHRHIRAGILRLAERAASLSRYCHRAILLLEEDEGRWSEEVLTQKTKPRIETLERILEQALDLQSRLRRLLVRLPFIARASTPRTPFRPTPIFLGRPAYREVYRTLLEARRYIGGRLDSDALHVRFRNLATLYEYWLFVKVVGLLREMYGPPVGNRAFSLIDEVYRPELAPGQQFRFRLPHGDVLTATYEPDFPPLTDRSQERYRAAFSTGTLRPDVALELSRPGRPPVILVLDAKSGPRFHKAQERLQQAAHYLWLVHDPHTGHQPVRQLFLVHRDPESPVVCNVTGYLEGRVSPPEARVLGAVPALPGETAQLRDAILRFLETFRARRWR